MPSRKPPSQRDPLARLSQAVRAGSPASMGGRVANATPVKATASASRRDVGPPPSSGDSEHNSTGSDSTAVGTGADAGDDGTAVGDASDALAGGSFGATAVGRTATASAGRTTAVGYHAVADGDRATAVGASASGSGTRAVSIGMFSLVDTVAFQGVAVGYSAHSAHVRAIALGAAATTTEDDQLMVRANSLELAQSTGAAGTTVVLLDTVDGTRQRISVASGAITVAPA